MIAISTCFDQLAVVASGNEAFSIGDTGENGAGMNDDTFFATFACE